MTDLQKWNLFVYYANQLTHEYLKHTKPRYWAWFSNCGLFAIKDEKAGAVTLRNPKGASK